MSVVLRSSLFAAILLAQTPAFAGQRVQADAGDLAAARTSLEFALEPPHGVRAYGAELKERARLDLGRVLIALGEDELGRAEYRRVLQQRTKRLGADHALTSAVREMLDER